MQFLEYNIRTEGLDVLFTEQRVPLGQFTEWLETREID